MQAGTLVVVSSVQIKTLDIKSLNCVEIAGYRRSAGCYNSLNQGLIGFSRHISLLLVFVEQVNVQVNIA